MKLHRRPFTTDEIRAVLMAMRECSRRGDDGVSEVYVEDVAGQLGWPVRRTSRAMKIVNDALADMREEVDRDN